MNTNPLRLVVPALCIVPLFLSAEPRGTRIAFGVEAGAKVRKTITQTSQMQLESLTMSVNGEERDMGELEQRGESNEKYVFLDEYKQVEKGELRALVRTYEEASDTQVQSMKSPRGEQSREREAKTELLGKSVAFQFDAEKDEWKREFVGDAGDDALLPGLDAEYELLGLLPEAEVGAGDQWELDTRALAALAFPGGDLGMHGEDDNAAEVAGRKAMRDAFEGKGKATFKGLREEGGVSLAEIEFEADVSAKWDVERDGGATEQRSMAMKLKGELAWNMSKQRAEHVEVEREGKLEMHAKSSMSRGEQSFEIATDTVLGLTGKDEFQFAPAD
ncbi:MAG: hypothetical protein EPO68_01985 [Planctomycetota bacterium]|nr:MAG: hypothetical protein EPO68_01985 [Planctomycetota bacterium]